MSREPAEKRLQELLSSGAVARKSLHDGILRRLPVGDMRDLDWGLVLSHFSVLGEHMNELWRDLDPSLSLYIPVPTRATADHNDGKNYEFAFIHFNGMTVALFLSTMLTAEDEGMMEDTMLTFPQHTNESIDVKGYNAAVLRLSKGVEDLEKVVRVTMRSSKSRRRPVNELGEDEFLQKILRVK